jgi:hypothetical protein
MKNMVLFLLLLIGPGQALAQTADFSGIWRTSTNNYISVHQKGNVAVMAILGDTDAFRGWEALRGNVVGSTARVTTLYGYVGIVYDAELTSSTTLKATQVSCAPLVPGYFCAYPNGAVITATKIF